MNFIVTSKRRLFDSVSHNYEIWPILKNANIAYMVEIGKKNYKTSVA